VGIFLAGQQGSHQQPSPWGWCVTWLGTGAGERGQAPQKAWLRVEQHAGHTELGQSGGLLL